MRCIAFSFGLSVFSIGLSTIFGYLLDLTYLYHWTGEIGMAFNSGIAFCLTGMAIIILASRPRRIEYTI